MHRTAGTDVSVCVGQEGRVYQYVWDRRVWSIDTCRTGWTDVSVCVGQGGQYA